MYCDFVQNNSICGMGTLIELNKQYPTKKEIPMTTLSPYENWKANKQAHESSLVDIQKNHKQVWDAFVALQNAINKIPSATRADMAVDLARKMRAQPVDPQAKIESQIARLKRQLAVVQKKA